jgi:hypothetical protein
LRRSACIRAIVAVLSGGDFGAGAPGAGDVFRVAQFDEWMIAVEVAECRRVHGDADVAVQVFGRGEQILCLEHAVAVADPPPILAAGQAEATRMARFCQCSKTFRTVAMVVGWPGSLSDNGRPAVRTLNRSSALARTFLGSTTAAASSATVRRR